MSDNLVIVAIPEQDDRVWKISSEKVPHLTLCFLGDAESKSSEQIEEIMKFVEHATEISEHGPFYLDVDHRDTLGDDEADVVFFNKRSYNLKWIKQFRAQLLQNSAIKTAYDSTEQHPEWLPHLTLGYPETPAKKLPDDGFDHPLYSINFDRIAVWTGNYEGPEFRLEWPEREDNGPGDAAWSADIAAEGADFLEHFGTKGMRWGIRKDESGGGVGIGVKETAKSAGKAVARGASAVSKGIQDANFEGLDRVVDKETGTTKRDMVEGKIVDKAADAFNRTDLPKIKAKPEYQDAKKLRNRLLHPRDPMTKQYRKEVKETYIQRLEDAANSMTNASGTRQYTIRERGWELPAEGGDLPRNGFWEVSSREIKHAAADSFILVEVNLDEDGFVDKITPVGNEMDHSDVDGDVLEHYGVQGMKWGVRKSDRPVETKKSMWDPEGHSLAGDVAKTAFIAPIPIVGLLAVPANVRLIVGGARGVNAKIIDREEKKFTAHAQSAKNFVDIHNGSADHFNREISGINKKYPDDMTKNPKLQKKYDDEVQGMMQNAYRESAKSIGNKNRTMHLDVDFKNDGMDFVIHAKEGAPTPLPKRAVQHAAEDDGDTLEFTGKIKRAPTGHIIDFVFDDLEPLTVEHSATDLGEAFVENFLEHYGVKGMKWGVQKTRFQSKLHERRVTAEEKTRAKRPAKDVRAYPTIGSSKRKKAKVDTKGGVDHPPTDDAVKVAVSTQKLKKSGVKALSNKELQEVQRRLNLENDVSRLMKGNRSAGQKFVDGLLGRGDKNDRKGTEYQLGDTARGVAGAALKKKR